MTELSQDELQLIRAHPLSKDLETFRATFQSRFGNTNVKEVINKLTTETPDKGEGGTLDSHNVTNR